MLLLPAISVIAVGLIWFLIAPKTPADSGVTGKVLLGPQCPVVRVGEECPDKPYATDIEIYRSGYLIQTTRSGSDGKFVADLPAGRYTLKPKGGNPFPICSEKDAEVFPHIFTETTLHCDTGIR